MNVYFLRHGPAGDREQWQGDDFDRPLTGDGRARIAREGKALAKLDLGLDLLLTSPLVRAKQTAQIVAERLGMEDRLFEDARLGLGFDNDALASILHDRAGVGTLMLVGHEPSMSETIGRLVGGAAIDFKKGGLACVDLEDAQAARGTLTLLVTPRVLSRKA